MHGFLLYITYILKGIYVMTLLVIKEQKEELTTKLVWVYYSSDIKLLLEIFFFVRNK